MRKFDVMENHLKDQIKSLGGEFKDFSDDVDGFFDYVNVHERNDTERKFRTQGKHHKSQIGKVNSGVESMEFALGGELHNEIGVANDTLELLFKNLKSEELSSVCDDVKVFLDSPKSAGGAGCTPGQHHGGQYNGENYSNL